LCLEFSFKVEGLEWILGLGRVQGARAYPLTRRAPQHGREEGDGDGGHFPGLRRREANLVSGLEISVQGYGFRVSGFGLRIEV